MARIQVECIAESTNEFEIKRGPVKETIISVIDRSPEMPRIKHAVDYVLSGEEESLFKGGKLIEKRLLLGITETPEAFDGTRRFKGMILEVDGKAVNGNGKAGPLGEPARK